jgi:hypothetical protein
MEYEMRISLDLDDKEKLDYAIELCRKALVFLTTVRDD